MMRQGHYSQIHLQKRRYRWMGHAACPVGDSQRNWFFALKVAYGQRNHEVWPFHRSLVRQKQIRS